MIGKSETKRDSKMIKWGFFPIFLCLYLNSTQIFSPPPFSNMVTNFSCYQAIPTYYDVL